jgi:hypothetical protein
VRRDLGSTVVGGESNRAGAWSPATKMGAVTGELPPSGYTHPKTRNAPLRLDHPCSHVRCTMSEYVHREREATSEATGQREEEAGVSGASWLAQHAALVDCRLDRVPIPHIVVLSGPARQQGLQLAAWTSA